MPIETKINQNSVILTIILQLKIDSTFSSFYSLSILIF